MHMHTHFSQYSLSPYHAQPSPGIDTLDDDDDPGYGGGVLLLTAVRRAPQAVPRRADSTGPLNSCSYFLPLPCAFALSWLPAGLVLF